jgi:NAD(P)-dependent dehydrogenase (short-subunit alcohol dehydrogenase family)
MQLKGQSAIVTGGASGIGAACARTLAREGAKVMVTDIDDARGRDLVADITKAGGTAAYQHQDVTDEAAWPGIVGATEKQFGGLHIMVANAGIGIMVPIWDMTLADWRRQQAINLDGVFLSVKYAIPAMRRCGGKGSIVMISSVAGLRGSPGLAAYSATKGGVRLFAKSVAMECAQAGDKIRVNSVHPGIIDTPIWGKIPSAASTSRGTNAAIDPHERASVIVPMGVAGSAQDIANGVLFLCSDAAGHMTASELVIDGGMTGGAVRRPA